MPEYLQEIKRLKQKYSDQLEIYAGLEIDYLDETYNASIPYFQELPLDYRIGSIHFLPVSERLVEENMVCIDGSLGNTPTPWSGISREMSDCLSSVISIPR